MVRAIVTAYFRASWPRREEAQKARCPLAAGCIFESGLAIRVRDLSLLECAELLWTLADGLCGKAGRMTAARREHPQAGEHGMALVACSLSVDYLPSTGDSGCWRAACVSGVSSQ